MTNITSTPPPPPPPPPPDVLTAARHAARSVQDRIVARRLATDEAASHGHADTAEARSGCRYCDPTTVLLDLRDQQMRETFRAYAQTWAIHQPNPLLGFNTDVESLAATLLADFL